MKVNVPVCSKRTVAAAAMSLSVLAAGARVSTAPPAGYRVTGVTMTDLGTVAGAPEGQANAINNRGEIVGWSTVPDGSPRAFVYRAGGIAPLAIPGAAFGSQAQDINNDSTIVGTAWPTLDRSRGFVLRGGALTWVARPPVDGRCLTRTFARALSDTEVIVGTGAVVGPPELRATACRAEHRAMLWRDGTPTFLPSRYPDQEQYPNDVDNGGAAVGFAWEVGAVPTIWDPYAMEILTPPPPAWAGSHGAGAAFGINETGRITGRHSWIEAVGGVTMRFAQAFVSGRGVPRAWLGVLATGTVTEGRGINEQGFVTGFGDTLVLSPLPGPPSYRPNAAFLWHASMGLHQLPRPASSWPSGGCEAYALNDRRADTGLIEVVGRCRTAAGRFRAIRWSVTTVLR